MKVFVLLFDGVGIRNFGFSGFYEKARQKGVEVVYWNGSGFPLQEKLNLPELKISRPRPHPLTDTVKTLKSRAEIRFNARRLNDKDYLLALLPLKAQNFKQKIKKLFIRTLEPLFARESGIYFLQRLLHFLERRTAYYRRMKETLEQHRPDLVLLTHQRPVTALAPVLAAKDLGIPTLGFIFSWDNLPKGTKVTDTDRYLVWSEYMKNELLTYYPRTQEDQIRITGTPQFEIHYDDRLKMPREDFFRWLGLPAGRTYICFSGDDTTTSPNDPYYLEDLARAVRNWNRTYGKNWHILFRPVPTDFSDYYRETEEAYKDVITRVQPLWEKSGKSWQTYFPTAGDGRMLANLAEHCEAVFNVGSSMVFDFVAHDKPTVYFRYMTEKTRNPHWKIYNIYRLIHFRSMPGEKAVIWLDNKDAYEDVFRRIEKGEYDLSLTRRWFDRINMPPQDKASERIINVIKNHG